MIYIKWENGFRVMLIVNGTWMKAIFSADKEKNCLQNCLSEIDQFVFSCVAHGSYVF